MTYDDTTKSLTEKSPVIGALKRAHFLSELEYQLISGGHFYAYWSGGGISPHTGQQNEDSVLKMHLHCDLVACALPLLRDRTLTWGPCRSSFTATDLEAELHWCFDTCILLIDGTPQQVSKLLT
jgi:hypothetical protein